MTLLHKQRSLLSAMVAMVASSGLDARSFGGGFDATIPGADRGNSKKDLKRCSNHSTPKGAPCYRLGTFTSQKPDGGNGWRKKQQAKHQKAANIRANGLPLEIVDTKRRSKLSPLAPQAVVLGTKKPYSKLCKLVASRAN